MKRIGLLWLVLVTTLFANLADIKPTSSESENNQTHMPKVLPKVLYLNYEETPQRVIKGEVFSVTLKTLSTISDFDEITYDFNNATGLDLLNKIPYRTKKGRYYFETFYFFVKGARATLPSFTAKLKTSKPIEFRPTTLAGQELNVVTLNPKKEFSGIIADSFDLQEYRTTSYDEKHNIIVFVARANNTNIKTLKLNNVTKQGFESVSSSIFESKFTYYAVVDKRIENFSFSYFNLEKNKFLLVNIPVIVDDDSVTTQTDLKPKDQTKEQLKMMIAAAVAVIAFVLILWRKKYIYLVFMLLPLGYIASIMLATKEVCIKSGSNIHLLPVHNGTIFETTASQRTLQKEGSVKEFIKVKLPNEKIGWIKNEDLCSR